MDTEFEVKFYVEKSNFREILKRVGAVLESSERKMRRVIFDKKFHPEFTCDFVRIRDEGKKVTMSAKTHTSSGNIEDEKETEIIINDYDKAIQIFEAMALKPDKYQETLRESWELNGCKIDIDTWPGLPTYCEIESDSEEKIKAVSFKLGFDWKDHIVSNSIDMYAEFYKIDVQEVLKRVVKLTFENNPFKDLV